MLKHLKTIVRRHNKDLIKNFEDIIYAIGRSKVTINTILFLLNSQINGNFGEKLSHISKKMKKKRQQIHTILHNLVDLGIVEKKISPVSNNVIYKLKNGSSFYRGVLCYVAYFALSKQIKQGKIKQNEI